MVNAATFSSGAALLSLGLSVYETLLAQTIGALLLVIGLCLNAAAGVKHLVGSEVHRDLMTWWMVYDGWMLDDLFFWLWKFIVISAVEVTTFIALFIVHFFDWSAIDSIGGVMKNWARFFQLTFYFFFLWCCWMTNFINHECLGLGLEDVYLVYLGFWVLGSRVPFYWFDHIRENHRSFVAGRRHYLDQLSHIYLHLVDFYGKCR